AQRTGNYLRARGGQLMGRPRNADIDSTAAHLLSGLLRCPCGSVLCAVSVGSRHGVRRYAYTCSDGHHRATCANRSRLPVPDTDAVVLDAIAEALAPHVVEAVIREDVARVNSRLADAATQRAAIVAELTAIAGKERKLLDAILDSDATVA